MYTTLLYTHGRNNTACIGVCEERRDHSGPSLPPVLCIIILLCYYYMIEPMCIIILRRIDITGSFAKNTIYFYFKYTVFLTFSKYIYVYICTHVAHKYIFSYTHTHTHTLSPRFIHRSNVAVIVFIFTVNIFSGYTRIVCVPTVPTQIL